MERIYSREKYMEGIREFEECNEKGREEFRRGELSERYTAKLLYGQNNKKFEEEYLKKLEKNWNRQKNNRKKREKEYVKKLEKSLKWNERDKQMSKIIQGDKKEVFLEAEP